MRRGLPLVSILSSVTIYCAIHTVGGTDDLALRNALYLAVTMPVAGWLAVRLYVPRRCPAPEALRGRRPLPVGAQTYNRSHDREDPVQTLILSHPNADFDAFAGMLAAQLLYPGARICLHGGVNRNVREFYNLHADEIPAVEPSAARARRVRRLVLGGGDRPRAAG